MTARRATCPRHPGIYTDNHPCHRCPQPEEAPVTTPLSAVPETAETAVIETFTRDDRAAFRQALKTTTIETIRDGLPVQPTLSDTVFPPVTRKNTRMVKLAFAGSVEMTVGRFLELLDDDLEVGAVVECAVTGHFKRLATGWKKRSEGSGDDKMTWWEQEGTPAIAVDDVAALHITGESWSDE